MILKTGAVTIGVVTVTSSFISEEVEDQGGILIEDAADEMQQVTG